MNDFPLLEHVVVYTRDTCVFIVLRRFTKEQMLASRARKVFQTG